MAFDLLIDVENTPGALVEVDDRPGALADLTRKIARA
jgi:hypothetical protein